MNKQLEKRILAAIELAKRKEEDRFIVEEDGKYYITTEYGLENFWLGQPVLFTITPDGEVITE